MSGNEASVKWHLYWELNPQNIKKNSVNWCNWGLGRKLVYVGAWRNKVELGHNMWVNHWPGPRAYWAVCLRTRVFVNGSYMFPISVVVNSRLHHQFVSPELVISYVPDMRILFPNGSLCCATSVVNFYFCISLFLSLALDFPWNKPYLHSFWEHCYSVSTGPWDFSTSLKDSPPTFPLLGFLYTCLVELNSSELIKMVVKITQVAVPYSKAACGSNSRLVSLLKRYLGFLCLFANIA